MIDIIIVNYKSTDFLTKCLYSIYKSLNGMEANIYIEDNESDGSIEAIRTRYDDVKISRNMDNLGFAKAVNRALSKCKSKYIILLNPDTIVYDHFFSGAVDFLNQNPEVGILGPQIINPDGTIQGSARSFPTGWTALFGRNTILTQWFPNNKISKKNILNWKCDGTSPMSVDWVSGACMVVRRSALQEVGFLDENFFMYWEDADWCRRMWTSGWKVAYYPCLTIEHNVGGSSSKSSVRSVVEFHKSAYRIFKKYYNNGYSALTDSLVYFALHFRLLFSLFRVGYNKLRSLLKGFQSKSLLQVLQNISSNGNETAEDKCQEWGKKAPKQKCSLLILNQYYPPDRSATAGVLNRMATALSKDYVVSILAGRPSYRSQKHHKWHPIRLQRIDDVSVIRVGSTAFPREKMSKRILNYISYLIFSMPTALLTKFDLIIALTDPPLAGMIAAIAAAIKRKPFIYYIQDLHPDMAITSGMIQPGLLSKLWEKIHLAIMSKADKVIVLGEDMQNRIIRKGINANQTMVIRHGALPPMPLRNLTHNKIEELRCGFGMAVIHAGNIGYYGAWDTLTQAAEKLKKTEAGIVFVGEGSFKSELIKKINGNDRIKFVPFRPRAEFDNVLAAGDMHLVTIRNGLEGTVVPSKLYPILSAGKPVLAVVPLTSDVAKIVTQFQCGEVVDPSRPDLMAEVMLKILRNPEELNKMGKQSKIAAQKISQIGELNKMIDIVDSLATRS